jgi:hypothetical protein
MRKAMAVAFYMFLNRLKLLQHARDPVMVKCHSTALPTDNVQQRQTIVFPDEFGVSAHSLMPPN